MTDDLLVICLVFVLLKEVGSAGKSDLVDVLLYLVDCHTESVIGEGDGLCLRVYRYIDARFVLVVKLCLADHLEFLQLGDGVRCI